MLRRAFNVLRCRFFGHAQAEAELTHVLNAALFRCPRCGEMWLITGAD